MEIAGQLAERAKRGPFAMDIIVCCFNGEEILHQGSEAFADKISSAYDEMYNINIGCIGGQGVRAIGHEASKRRVRGFVCGKCSNILMNMISCKRGFLFPFIAWGTVRFKRTDPGIIPNQSF